MLKRTPLFELHRAAGARMVDFGGWEMPLHYGSQIDEHAAVRSGCGMFDVSHMRVIDLSGPASLDFLRLLLANDAARLEPGRALYSCMLRDDGGVIDDLIVYRSDRGNDRGSHHADAGTTAGAQAVDYRIVVNAATAETDLAWMQAIAAGRGPAPATAALDVRLQPRPDLALIAVQGPAARARLGAAVPRLAEALGALRPFSAVTCDAWFVGRTGYTGEDGFEIALAAPEAADLWRALQAQAVVPCGLGARDTLRLEAGMNLYGGDMDQSVTPFESGLAWTVDLRAPRPFVGRAALERQQAGPPLRQLLGLRLLGRGVLRAHQQVATAHGAGEITSGTFAPTVGGSIALARLPAGVAPGDEVTVELRSGPAPARVCRPPFVRNGKVLA